MPYFGRAPAAIGTIANVIEGDLKVKGTISGESINDKFAFDTAADLDDHFVIEDGGTDGSATNAGDNLLLEDTTEGLAESVELSAITDRAGTSGQLLTSAGAFSSPTFTTLSVAPWTYGTQIVDSSNNSEEFTGIPSTATDIDLFFNLMSFTGTVSATVVIGDGGGYETSAYSGDSFAHEGGNLNQVTHPTTSFTFRTANGESNAFNGVIRVRRMDTSGFVYMTRHQLVINGSITTSIQGSGSKTLSAVLDRIKISGGTFDGNSTFQVRYR